MAAFRGLVLFGITELEHTKSTSTQREDERACWVQTIWQQQFTVFLLLKRHWLDNEAAIDCFWQALIPFLLFRRMTHVEVANNKPQGNNFILSDEREDGFLSKDRQLSHLLSLPTSTSKTIIPVHHKHMQPFSLLYYFTVVGCKDYWLSQNIKIIYHFR
jgi:hypothetical protein